MMEYTTQQAISIAKQCAWTDLNSKSFPTDPVASNNAIASLSIASDQHSATYTLSKWRLAITGTNADAQYKIILQWRERVNGFSRTFTEERVTNGSDQP